MLTNKLMWRGAFALLLFLLHLPAFAQSDAECHMKLAPIAGPGEPPPPAQYSCPGQRYIRIAVHFMTRATPIAVGNPARDEYGNFTELDDGRGGTATNAFAFAEGMIWALVIQQNQNVLNDGSSYSPIPVKRYNFALDGVYVHRTDDQNLLEYDFGNAQSTYLNATYGVNRDSVINIFLLKSTESTQLGGIAGRGPASQFGLYDPPNRHTMWSKIVNCWDLHEQNPGISWEAGKILAHEMGHLLDLGHTEFTPQQCPDAPAAASDNNVVRSGSTSSISLTPCQVDIANQTIDDYGRAYLYSCGCHRSTASATLPATVCGGAPIVLDARASFQEASYELTIHRTSAVGSHVNTGGLWQQSFAGSAPRVDLRSIYAFTPGIYRVKLTTFTNGGGCPGDVAVRWVQVLASASRLCNLPQSRPGAPPTGAVEVSPNPATSHVAVRVYNPLAEAVTVRFRDGVGRLRAVAPAPPAASDADGWQTFTYPTATLGGGIFRVEATVGGGQRCVATVVVTNP